MLLVFVQIYQVYAQSRIKFFKGLRSYLVHNRVCSSLQRYECCNTTPAKPLLRFYSFDLNEKVQYFISPYLHAQKLQRLHYSLNDVAQSKWTDTVGLVISCLQSFREINYICKRSWCAAFFINRNAWERK